MADGLAAHPGSAELHNSAGSLFQRGGAHGEAEQHFAQAARLAPANPEFVINRAIALNSMKRPDAALGLLRQVEKACTGQARYWSVRGASEQGSRRLREARASYERCLALQPGHPRAVHSLARIALEMGDGAASRQFDAAIRANPGDPSPWLGKAQALDVDGDHAAARSIMEQVAQQAPGWTEGLAFLTQLRLAAGDDDPCTHYAEAASRHPADPNIPFAHVEALSGLNRNADAAAIAAEARRRFPAHPAFMLLEALHASTAGDEARAEDLFASLTLDTLDRHIHEARHRIRRGEFETAAAHLDTALQREPWDISAWALRGIVWRMTGDPRAQWLHGQEGMVQKLPLDGADDLVGRSVAYLRELHAGSPFPLGQSLRGGTQTRGILFDRSEPILEELHAAIRTAVHSYRRNLPAPDPAHPLLRHAGSELRLEGSWSVRLTGGGDYHASHIHPQGILSSALYLVVPDDAEDEEARSGWLEIGRPPPDLRLDLEPLDAVQPEPGYLALFPSYLYHGTAPFGDAERMTVAFDVIAVPELAE